MVEVRGEKESGWERETGSHEERGRWIIRHGRECWTENGREGRADSYIRQSHGATLVCFFLAGQHLITAVADREYGYKTKSWWVQRTSVLPSVLPSLPPSSVFFQPYTSSVWLIFSFPSLFFPLFPLLPPPLPLSLSSLSSRYLAIGEDSRCFIELDTPSLPQDHMTRIEDLCNESIRRGIPMTPRWYSPTAPELEDVSLPYFTIVDNGVL